MPHEWVLLRKTDPGGSPVGDQWHCTRCDVATPITAYGWDPATRSRKKPPGDEKYSPISVRSDPEWHAKEEDYYNCEEMQMYTVHHV
jgi:hypothetical protein